MTSAQMKGHPTLLVLRKAQIKTAMRIYYTCNRMGKKDRMDQVLASMWTNTHACKLL